MTVKIQKANLLDKILILFGKKRAVILPPVSNICGYYLARRENFFRALFRPACKPLPKGRVYPGDLTDAAIQKDRDTSCLSESMPVHPSSQGTTLPYFRGSGTGKVENARPDFLFVRQFKKTLISFLIGFLSIWLLIFVGHSFVDSIFDRIERDKAVHQDDSLISSGIKSQVKNKIALVYKNEAGELTRVIADRESLSSFAMKQLKILEEKRIEVRASIQNSIENDNKKSFQALDRRITDYADWYFGYTTTYKICGVAVSSALSHSLETSTMPLLDAVALDVEEYLEKHFEKIVLKPEISDPVFQQNYNKNLKYAHGQFLSVIADFNSDFQRYVAENTSHLESLDHDQITVEIDWASQFHKVSMAGYEKGAGGAVVGVGLTVVGAAAGKAIGGSIGKVLAGKALASAAGKSLTAKLAAPFASKAVAVTGSAAAGGTAGTVWGPVGTLVGAGAGVLADYLLNEGVELLSRDTFERDTRIAIASFKNELNKHEIRSLHTAVDIWFNDVINLLADFEE